MGWDTILFDLDGTLTDPKEGITKAAAYALDWFGIREDPDCLTKFIGPPLDESFSEFYGFDDGQTTAAVEKFREYFSRQGWHENIPYPGMDGLLRDLKNAGKRLIVATSKPEMFAVRILDHFDLSQYFYRICGAPSTEQRGVKKADVIRNALNWTHGDLSQVVMVGDRRHDVDGAHAMGLKAIGVLYGYGDLDELQRAGADYIAPDLNALRKLLVR